MAIESVQMRQNLSDVFPSVPVYDGPGSLAVRRPQIISPVINSQVALSQMFTFIRRTLAIRTPTVHFTFTELL